VAGAYLSGIQQAIEILASSTLPFNPTSWYPHSKSETCCSIFQY